MVVPILRSTGVNTKLLPGLQLGVPIVLTSVSASPLGIPQDDSVALLADDSAAFVSQLRRLHEAPSEALRLAAAAKRHWTTLLEEDATASDLTPLLALACDVLQVPDAARPLPSPIVPPNARSLATLRTELAAAGKEPPSSRCWPQVPLECCLSAA